ncbi:MAG: MFS transporter [Alphaproteobacteria bacterium]|nr:MFS transporter [Alphaproteobacteria bacterium]MDE2112322.1 MFS transporter [Alphaproteobacteria bacterium]MDE2494280.1 MFS transporter [Alphaproteobacteria bacterium]
MNVGAAGDDRPVTIRWLPPGLRPPGGLTARQELVFLLVGAAAVFGGYDTNVFGFAVPQVQASLHIAEDKIGLTVSIFRLAAIAALVLAWSADLIGRRRLLLFTIAGQALATFATGFAQDYAQFVWLQTVTRTFGYAEEMLCYVVVAEEISAQARGWANGTLAAMYYAGGGVASLVFVFISTIGWRGMYIVGSIPIFLVAYLRRYLPETKRFEVREHEVEKLTSRIGGAIDLTRRLLHEHPRRVTVILIAIAAYGFAIWPAAVFGQKYLQSVLHFTPGETTALILPGGLVAVTFNILAGRLSDWIGRKAVIFGACFVAMASYGTFYSGVHWQYVAYMWVPGFFGFLCADSLFAGLSAEIFPTAYRATVSGLRYLVSILCGAVSLALEGPLYNFLGGHGPALIVLMMTMPIAMIALLRLPEPAGRSLEDIAAEADKK